MGTNYYAEIGTKKVICEYGCEHIVPDVLHIGKNSYGWVFHLQGYDDSVHQLKSLEDWKNVLKSAKRIYNEYNDTLTYDDMMKIILKPSRILTKKEMEKLEADLENENNGSYHKLAIKNGLWGCAEYMNNTNAGPDENYEIDYMEFS